jgi:hypothetical protein
MDKLKYNVSKIFKKKKNNFFISIDYKDYKIDS